MTAVANFYSPSNFSETRVAKSNRNLSRKTLDEWKVFPDVNAQFVPAPIVHQLGDRLLLFEKWCDRARLTESRRLLIPGGWPETMWFHTPDFHKSCPLKDDEWLEIVHIGRIGRYVETQETIDDSHASTNMCDPRIQESNCLSRLYVEKQNRLFKTIEYHTYYIVFRVMLIDINFFNLNNWWRMDDCS